MSIILEFIYISCIIIIVSIFLLSSLLLSCFKVEDISDGLSVSSESSSKSKEYSKSYITRMNTYINQNMKFELPDLNLKTYIKETKKYREHFPFSNYKFQRPKKNILKNVSFKEGTEIEEQIFI